MFKLFCLLSLCSCHLISIPLFFFNLSALFLIKTYLATFFRNILRITELLYLCGHVHILMHSPSHQTLYRETLNQDSPFKQTSEL